MTHDPHAQQFIDRAFADAAPLYERDESPQEQAASGTIEGIGYVIFFITDKAFYAVPADPARPVSTPGPVRIPLDHIVAATTDGMGGLIVVSDQQAVEIETTGDAELWASVLGLSMAIQTANSVGPPIDAVGIPLRCSKSSLEWIAQRT